MAALEPRSLGIALAATVTLALAWACGDDASSQLPRGSDGGGGGTAAGGNGMGGCLICGGTGGKAPPPTGGAAPTCNSPDECPGDDTTCATRTCPNNICDHEFAPKGTACSDNDGTLCNGTGQCIVCNKPTTPPGNSNCPAVCSQCDGNTCIIDCTSDCSQQTINCPSDFACVIECGSGECQGKTLNCEPTHACDITCAGANACAGATLNCSSGICNISCSGAQSACSGAAINCGAEVCAASCDSGAAKPSMNCVASCQCTQC